VEFAANKMHSLTHADESQSAASFAPSTSKPTPSSRISRLILLDIDLGDMSGFVVADKLRSTECRARIVFLSVHESIDFIRAAQDLGAAATSANRRSPATS
jgi:DNA-binding NarL/FixJ family response regulator